ncbi:MAG: tryptophan 2,3-dioxygenase [Myxococcota bacterium]|nr:tryptophan 2,3-dioxygenase [Myxococcota bacterium]
MTKGDTGKSKSTTPKNQVDLKDEKVQWDFRQEMSYADYLGLEKVLSAQRQLSGHHDEALFLIIHQVSELWMKLVLHELHAARELVKSDDLSPAFKMLSRVSKVQNQLKQAWDVLSTMTPADYVAFRDALGHSSGFQSYQYRMIEFILGNKNAAMIEVHRHDPDIYTRVRTCLNEPSLYDECIRLLSRRGFEIQSDYVERDWSLPYEENASVHDAWLTIYQDTDRHWDLYALAEKLVDVEDNFQQWRFRHMTTVKRVIGFKRGTGGTSGVGYLSKALSLKFFPELWSLRTAI